MNQVNEYRGAIAVKMASDMKKIDQDDSGWTSYYRDERTGEQWVLDYPGSAQHGGGSARLRRFSDEP